MRVIGLTGSIGMGKSTTAAMFAEQGIPVFDADAAVHALYATGGEAVPLVEAAFPGVTKDGAVDREALRQAILGAPEAIRRIGEIVHPLVHQKREAFFDAVRARKLEIAVLDVPLLLENGGDSIVDALVVVSSTPEIQRARALAREGMTPERLDAILAQQMPDAEKRRRADFVIDTSHGLEPARAQVAAVLEAVRDPAWVSRRKSLGDT